MELPPAVQLQNLVMGKMMTQMIGVAARLGIADLLRDGPKSVAELAATAGAHERALYRLLRALASMGIFAETDPGVFALTPMAEALRQDTRDSVRGFALLFSNELHDRAWSALMHSVTTGGSAAEHALGMKGFEFFTEHPAFHAEFDDAMTALSRQAAFPVVQAYDFSGFERVVDVGGGQGFLLAAILQASPTTQGVLYDLPEVVQGAPSVMEAAGVSDRCELVGGSFFERVPEGADCYVSKVVIHDWDDEAASTILRHCREAMRPGGRVLLVEAVIPPGNDPHPGKLIDIEMLAMTQGGYERTAEEFRRLFEAAGLHLGQIVPTASHLSVIEALA